MARIGSILALVCLTLIAVPRAGLAQPNDPVVALVNEAPIHQSDLDRLVRLDWVDRTEEEEDSEFRARVVEELIGQRLRSLELQRYGLSEIPVDEVEADLEELRVALGGSLGDDEEAVRALVTESWLARVFAEERLGARMLIRGSEIDSFYQETVVPEYRERRAVPPPLEEVRDRIRERMRDERIDEEIATWTSELREEATVESLLPSS